MRCPCCCTALPSLLYLPVCLQLQQLDLLKACVGWELEGAAEDPVSGETTLRLAGLFRLHISVSRAGASARLEMLPGGRCCCAMLAVPAGYWGSFLVLAWCTGGQHAQPALQMVRQ